ncbi:uncharacterized protein MONOS_15641 [Monocercomonoides exilis]|uniref:uncharacterized protein n=1 Tax=Monocercomonoides exilis TaxID=2049356 RepID=UPI00355A3E79|nr:hypothetical protein MONOS_15641 [Monocercomonoides exilis]|eukprot:MONOS_15641.1-p1 / transcript=MONOS_15641.1 / gene=MONOS_15641 / organism=Monocercomonoides_exilis_PA203 / gene_product=unspecified product / transcript_product=unspecified product / location=Mono_scaffold01294:10457-10849(+) / protein_length=131 / sequence_SO=supercontig / SO=protein_coding / is_pseudo=false
MCAKPIALGVTTNVSSSNPPSARPPAIFGASSSSVRAHTPKSISSSASPAPSSSSSSSSSSSEGEGLAATLQVSRQVVMKGSRDSSSRRMSDDTIFPQAASSAPSSFTEAAHAASNVAKIRSPVCGSASS